MELAHLTSIYIDTSTTVTDGGALLMWQGQSHRVARITMPTFILALALTQKTCPNPFYDEGARFADHVAKSAAAFRKSGYTEAVFEYVPKYGVNQTIRVWISRISWCPHRLRRPLCTYISTSAVQWYRFNTAIQAQATESRPRQVCLEVS